MFVALEKGRLGDSGSLQWHDYFDCSNLAKLIKFGMAWRENEHHPLKDHAKIIAMANKLKQCRHDIYHYHNLTNDEWQSFCSALLTLVEFFGPAVGYVHFVPSFVLRSTMMFANFKFWHLCVHSTGKNYNFCEHALNR